MAMAMADEPIVSRLTFWQSLEQEIVAAKNSNCMVLVWMDAMRNWENT